MKRFHNKAKKYKWAIAVSGILLSVCVLLIIASNILVSAALVPSFMERLSAFEKITDESYAALVHTDDIAQNQLQSEKDIAVWMEEVQAKELTKKLTTYSSDGYKLVARVYYQEQESHKWVILFHGYTGWKEEMNPIACEYAKRGYQVLTPDMRCQGKVRVILSVWDGQIGWITESGWIIYWSRIRRHRLFFRVNLWGLPVLC